MFLDLPSPFIWVLNTVGLAGLPLMISWLFIRLPHQLFASDKGITKLLPFEKNGTRFTRILRIKRWKRWLPDGGAWMKNGFAKKKLAAVNPVYIEQFMRETRRGEWAHWCMLLSTPLFSLWNEGWSLVIVLTYAFAVNVPCILVQRYNRSRFSRLMLRRDEICYPKKMTSARLEEF
ncbi:hypothetical protein [Paenibacillus sinopodophylli]|uniref:glycosyl-4,4'-diaponeurosporenoate acyltransferase CrtO family protein n=1 Tax=Paenibacillus sinopodophylli TaxID=1837342 RepID=UPI00110D1E82|nr:hypothetical protein [Paenibacillus sinopodophylli]